MPLLQTSNSSLDIVMTLDPAISERTKADRSCIMVMGMSPASRIYILDYWVGRQGDPDKIIENMLNLADTWMPRCIGIETIAYQQALMPYTEKMMKQRGRYYSIIQLKPDRNGRVVEKKNMRILSMVPYFKAGQVFILKGMLDFIEEFETFPLGQTVDILDAMAYGFRLLVPRSDAADKPGQLVIDRLKLVDPTSAKYWRAYQVKKGFMEEETDPLLDDDPVYAEEPFRVGCGELC